MTPGPRLTIIDPTLLLVEWIVAMVVLLLLPWLLIHRAIDQTLKEAMYHRKEGSK